MNKLVVGVTLVLLILGFAFSTVAAYKGAGLVASGTGSDSNSSRSSVWFPVFVGGGPGGGK